MKFKYFDCQQDLMVSFFGGISSCKSQYGQYAVRICLTRESSLTLIALSLAALKFFAEVTLLPNFCDPPDSCDSFFTSLKQQKSIQHSK